MRVNFDLVLSGAGVHLVPYRRRYVHRYHGWMQSEVLREQTASEALSLEAELKMQQSWLDDDDKLTFIIIDRDLDGSGAMDVSAAIGDVNLFLNDPDGDRSVGELEVMIAEESARGKGRATEALRLFMHFAISDLAMRRFYVKIGAENEPSLRLFTDTMGFQQCNYVKAFDEYELELLVDDSTLDGLLEGCRGAYDALAGADAVEGPARDERSPAVASEDGTGQPAARQDELVRSEA